MERCSLSWPFKRESDAKEEICTRTGASWYDRGKDCWIEYKLKRRIFSWSR